MAVCSYQSSNLLFKQTMKHKFSTLFLFLTLALSANAQNDTISLKTKSVLRPYIAPSALVVGGLITQGAISKSLRDDFWQKNFVNFHSPADNYLIYTPAAVAFGLDVVGVQGKHEFGDKIVLLVLSNALSTGIVQGLKHAITYIRPDASDNYSFPSGHTTAAFTNATFLHKEYGEQSAWYSVGGYYVAAMGGTMRMLNNKHWLSDVLVGAGIGIVSTEVVYAIYPYLQETFFKPKKKQKAMLLPTFNGGGMGMVWTKRI
jgi:membrane-associated phospholipid phosphatase